MGKFFHLEVGKNTGQINSCSLQLFIRAVSSLFDLQVYLTQKLKFIKVFSDFLNVSEILDQKKKKLLPSCPQKEFAICLSEYAITTPREKDSSHEIGCNRL